MSHSGADRIVSVDQLETAVGRRPPGWHLKSIPVLDDHCAALLARSPFAVLGVRSADGRLESVPLGGAPGVVEVVDRDRVRLGALADALPREQASAGLLALIPGYRETLRVNGRLSEGDLVVEEAFLHCAKCMIRSRLWDAASPADAGGSSVVDADLDHPDVVSFLERSPFLVLISADADGQVDASPRGDPPGFALRLGPTTLALPDRPGNRRTDTFHNLVARPEIALLALVPGDERVVHVTGRARLTEDHALRARAEVKGHLPAVMLVVETTSVRLEVAPALGAAQLWDATRHLSAGELPKASRIWSDHLKLNDDPGLAARIARSALPERLLAMGLAQDYKKNLY